MNDNHKQKFYSIIGIRENGTVLECCLVSGLPRKLAILYLKDWKKYQPTRYDRYIIREDKQCVIMNTATLKLSKD